MRLIAALAGIAVLAALALAWATGGLDALAFWAAGAQREAQNAMAGTLRALKAGEGAALWTLCGLSAAYGFVHAVGPGHGKLLLGGAAMATRAPLGRMVGLSLAAGIAQALAAVVLVHGGLLLVETAAAPVVGLAERWLDPASHALIAAIGLVLVWRGGRGLMRLRPADGHVHDHAPGCGHSHGPDPAAVARLSGWREGAALVASIAIRPCSGAIILLFIAWRLDLVAAGLAAVLAMGLGTAAFNAMVAAGAVGTRDALLLGGGSGRVAAVLAPSLTLAGGAMVALIGFALALAALPG